MKLNTEIKIDETKTSDNKIMTATSIILTSIPDDNGKAKIILHTHYPNASAGAFKDRYRVFVEV